MVKTELTSEERKDKRQAARLARLEAIVQVIVASNPGLARTLEAREFLSALNED
jgi:hypothetical protein